MNNNSMVDIERLKDQLLSNPKCKLNDEHKETICKRLQEQLVEKEAVVKIQRMDAECLNLIDNLQQRLLFLQDVISPSKKRYRRCEIAADKTTKENIKFVKKEFNVDGLFELNLSSDSSDDEALSVKIAKNKTDRATESLCKQNDTEEIEAFIAAENNQQEHEIDLQQDSEPICPPLESDIPLALRRQSRERKSSYISLSSPSSSSKNVNNQFVSKKHRCISHGQKETFVSTSGVAYHDDEDVIVEEDCDRPHTFHIKIPSLFKGQVHELRLDSLEFGRKVFDYRAKQAKQKCLQLKQQQQQLDCLTNTKKRKSQKKNAKLTSSRHQEILQQQDAQFSQLIEDVMNETGNEETLRATKALENINNDINDNYESIASLLPLSQSSQELSLSQNSMLSSNINEGSTKKRRKTTKRSNDQNPNEPVQKRGRKPKLKNTSEIEVSTQSQAPTKSNLAKYVEYFANDCELLPPGSQTPAASSTKSQPLVSSTTHNFELIDHQQQQSNQQIQQQAITYFIDGDWANGGPCQLVQTTGMTIDACQINQDAMSAPFQDFVNYIDNNTDTGNNVIARVLDNCNSLPISIPIPLANMGYQNIYQARSSQQQNTQNMLNQPVINIQIPSLPSIPNNNGPQPPPVAHLHEEGVLDLSIKSNATINTYEVLDLNKNSKQILDLSATAIADDNCLPLDLSIKNVPPLHENCCNTSSPEESQSQLSTVEIQDDDFIRRLIETSGYDLRPQELTKDVNYSNNTSTTTNSTTTNSTTYDDGKSFKAALNMPLLEFDVHVLDQLVENSTPEISGVDENEKLNGDNVSTNGLSNNDSNYVSMNDSDSNVLNSPFGNEIHFADQSTKEIFNKLLDIRPPDDICNLEYVADLDAELDESTFVNNNVQNSTMYERDNVTNQKNSKEKQDNCSIIQQIILESTSEEKTNNNKTNDNKPATVQKFLPRILKRRNSLFKKTIPNYQEKSNDDDNAKNVENLNANPYKSAAQTETTTNIITNTPSNDDLMESVKPTAEANLTTKTSSNDATIITTNTPSNDDLNKSVIAEENVATNDDLMKSVKPTSEAPNLATKTPSNDATNITTNTPSNDDLNKSVIAEPNVATNTPSNVDLNKSVKLTSEAANLATKTPSNDDGAKNENFMKVVKINEKRKYTKRSTKKIKDLYLSTSSGMTSNPNSSKNEQSVNDCPTKLGKDTILMDEKEKVNIIVKLSSNNSTMETLNYSINENLGEFLEEVKKTSTISKDSLEQSLPTASLNKYHHLEQSLKLSENEKLINLINECPPNYFNKVETVELFNTKQSTSSSGNKQSGTETENLNMDQLSDSSIILKISEIENLNPKNPVCDFLENSNYLKKSINIHSPKISTDTDISRNLVEFKSNAVEKSNKSIEMICPEIEFVLEKSNNSIQINSPDKSTESDLSLHLVMSESDSSEKSGKSDVPLNLEMSESDSTEKSNSSNQSINSAYKSIEADATVNFETETFHEVNEISKIKENCKDTQDEIRSITNENVSSKTVPDCNTEKTHISSKDAQDEIRSINNENVSSEAVPDCNTVCFNEKVVFSMAKITLSDDDALLTDSDTTSRKSYDHVPTPHRDIELKMDDSKMEVQSNSVNLKIGCSDHDDFEHTCHRTAESNSDPLCLTTTDIQKKYYAESCISDVIDLSVKYDTDIEDNLIMDLDQAQSPEVVKKLIPEQCHRDKTENTENPTATNETIQDTASKEEEGAITNNEIYNDNIDGSVENILVKDKQQTSNVCPLKTAPDISHLTPLELDSKLEDTLDFDEDFDDALSLATSCFDSPNDDDRFEESFLDESEQQTSVGQITNNHDNPCIDKEVTEQTVSLKNLQTAAPKVQPASNGLRNFKIPKITVSSSTTQENKDIQIKCKDATANSSSKINIPVIPNITMKKAIVKLENITRTVKNELAATTGSVNVVQLQHQQPDIVPQSLAKQHVKINFIDKQPQQLLPSSTTSELELKNCQALPICDNITKLFGITCQPYLVNKCYAISHCPLSHQLNDPDSVFAALGSLSTFDLSNAYRYIYNHSNMFKVFFIVFCNLFTLRKDRTKLLNMINDVERYPEYSQFLIAIYEAIVQCGLSRVNACRQILKRSRERTTFHIDALVAIIMKSDWTMFTDYLEQYTEEIYKYNYCIGVLEQMVPAVLNSKGPQLKQVFGKCVQTLRCEDTGLLLNSPSLIQCVALLTSIT